MWYVFPPQENKGTCRNYYTATFSLQFQHRGDVCYVAYHYPYTHSRLLADLTDWQLRAKQAALLIGELNTSRSSELYFKIQNLTSTLLDNPVPVVTVTQTDQPGPSKHGEIVLATYAILVGVIL